MDGRNVILLCLSICLSLPVCLSVSLSVSLSLPRCACVCVCVYARTRACARVCVRARIRVCASKSLIQSYRSTKSEKKISRLQTPKVLESVITTRLQIVTITTTSVCDQHALAGTEAVQAVQVHHRQDVYGERVPGGVL